MVSSEGLQIGFKCFSKVGSHVVACEPNKSCAGLVSISNDGVLLCSIKAKCASSLAKAYIFNSFFASLTLVSAFPFSWLR